MLAEIQQKLIPNAFACTIFFACYTNFSKLDKTIGNVNGARWGLVGPNESLSVCLPHRSCDAVGSRDDVILIHDGSATRVTAEILQGDLPGVFTSRVYVFTADDDGVDVYFGLKHCRWQGAVQMNTAILDRHSECAGHKER